MWAINFFAQDPVIPSLGTHLRSNLALLKFWCYEYYLPKQERSRGFVRLGRYLIVLCVYLFISGLFLKGDDGNFNTICSRRDSCKFNCSDENFPDLECSNLTTESVAIGNNVYTNLYKYPYAATAGWSECADYANDNLSLYRSLNSEGHSPRIHTCFPMCQGSILPSLFNIQYDPVFSFANDTRAACTGSENQSNFYLYCVSPEYEPCYKGKIDGELCFDDGKEACISFGLSTVIMFVSVPIIFLWDLLSLIFVKVQPVDVQDLSKQAKKVGFILLLFIFAAVTIVGIISIIISISDYGRIYTLLLNFVVVILLDMIRTIIFQIVVWYFLLRRAGQLNVNEPPIQQSLLDDDKGFVKVTKRIIKAVVEADLFEKFFIGIVLLYAVVILLQLSLGDDMIKSVSNLSEAFQIMDLVFLSLFMLELILKVISFGFAYFLDVWSAIDAVIVIASMVLAIITFINPGLIGSGTQGLVILRLLRLLRLVLVIRKASSDPTSKLHVSDGSSPFVSPVEKVISILRSIKDLKGITAKDIENIEWLEDVISGNKLYSVSVDLFSERNLMQSNFDVEIQQWLKIASDPNFFDGDWESKEVETLLVGKMRKRQQLLMQKKEEENRMLQDNKEEVLIESDKDGLKKRRKKTQKEQDETVNNTNNVLKKKVTKDVPESPRKLLKNFEDQKNKKDRKLDKKVPDSSDDETGNNDENELSLIKPTEQPEVTFARMFAPKDIEAIQDFMKEWCVDIFALSSIIDTEMLLPAILVSSFSVTGIFSQLEIDSGVLFAYGSLVRRNYFDSNNFSNHIHAADCIHSMSHFLRWLSHERTGLFGSVEMTSALLATLIIDLGNPGVQSNHIIKTQHPLAERYNYESPLEHYSCSKAFELMWMKNGANPLKNISEDAYYDIRKMVISTVLSSDPTTYLSQIAIFKTKATRKDFPSTRFTDKQSILSLFLIGADLSFTTKTADTCLDWANRYMDELFIQGDVEKTIHLEVAPLCDRDISSVSKNFLGVFEVLVNPVFYSIGKLIPNNEHNFNEPLKEAISNFKQKQGKFKFP